MTSVAARFDTTPSELAKLNRLPQRLPLFPGQVLYIPAERAAGRPTSGNATDSTTNSDTYQLRRPSDPTSDDALAPGATTAAGATDLPWSDGAADQERGNKWSTPDKVKLVQNFALNCYSMCKSNIMYSYFYIIHPIKCD